MTDEASGAYGRVSHVDAAADETFLVVAEALAHALRSGHPTALSDYVARYPAYAAALAEYALYFRTTELALPLNESVIPDPELSPVARRALQRVSRARQTIAGIQAEANRQGVELAALAARINLSAGVLTKLDSGLIDPTTVPTLLIERLARALDCACDAIRAVLFGPDTAGPAAQLQGVLVARERPAGSAYGRESFAQAVQQSPLLAEADRAAWLQAIADEGHPHLWH